MDQDLSTMTQIMHQKDADLAKAEPPVLDAEGKKLAENKRFTLDQHEDVNLDPLR